MRVALLASAAVAVVPVALVPFVSAQTRPAATEPMSPPPIAMPASLPVLPAAEHAKMDHDLLEIDIPRLHALYAAHKYTVEQVTRWYMGRIARYNGIYRAVQTVNTADAGCRSGWRSARGRGRMAICLDLRMRTSGRPRLRRPPVLVESGLLTNAR